VAGERVTLKNFNREFRIRVGLPVPASLGRKQSQGRMPHDIPPLAQYGHGADESVQDSSVRVSASRMLSGNLNQMNGSQVLDDFGFGG
jgi:hypothetical protein